MSRNGASSPQDGAGGAGMGERAMFILFPELADESPSYIAGLTFSEEAEANIQAIADALAEERAKARAPFLQAGLQLTALAERYQSEWLEHGGPVANRIRSNAYADAALRIRRAAEDIP